MNLEELINKYLGEWLGNGCKVRIEYCWSPDPDTQWCISYYGTWDGMAFSTESVSGNLEKGLETIRERLQKL